MTKQNKKQGENEIIVRCGDKICFQDINRKIFCSYCEKKNLYLRCPFCNKEHKIESVIQRVDCVCGNSFLPCSINKYRFENNKND